jgi:VanZ like family
MPLLSATILGYMILLVLLATASPGIGWLGLILPLFSKQALDYLHAPAYGLLAWFAITGLLKRGWPASSALAVGSFFSLVFGCWTETLQLSVPGRGLEVRDVVIDTIGIVTAAMIAFRNQPRLDPLRRGRETAHYPRYPIGGTLHDS